MSKCNFKQLPSNFTRALTPTYLNAGTRLLLDVASKFECHHLQDDLYR